MIFKNGELKISERVTDTVFRRFIYMCPSGNSAAFKEKEYEGCNQYRVDCYYDDWLRKFKDTLDWAKEREIK